jgi:hypothetical protein
MVRWRQVRDFNRARAGTCVAELREMSRVSLRMPLLAVVLAAAGCDGSIVSSGGDRGGEGQDPGAPLACPDSASPGGDGGAMVFDGVNDHVTMGNAAELGLTTFTVEAWVRRDGKGIDTTTGVGGLRLVPIAGKGRGEGDGSNLDCNYAFGFWGDVLGADFEDTATGANHPVFGRTAIPIGEWHHVAATYDGTAWRLYLDGVLDGEAVANATPRADSIQHFAIATTMDSKGAPAGFFDGAIDEVRVWKRPLTADEIAEGLQRTIAMADGLVGRWGLDSDATASDPAPIANSTGGAAGAIAGEPTYTDDDAALDRGSPPLPGAPTPADGAAVAAAVTLDLELEMASRAPVDVTYHVRELTEQDDFTIVVMPDTQYYTREGLGDERFFYAQTRWVRDHRKDYNIVAVIHNGDLVNNGETLQYQWGVARTAMATLDRPEDDLPDGVPYAIAVGNHDQTPNGAPGTTVSFNRDFGLKRFAGRTYYGGHYGTSNDESFITFSAGGLDFVVVNLQYNVAPDPAVLAWGRSIFQRRSTSASSTPTTCSGRAAASAPRAPRSTRACATSTTCSS